MRKKSGGNGKKRAEFAKNSDFWRPAANPACCKMAAKRIAETKCIALPRTADAALCFAGGKNLIIAEWQCTLAISGRLTLRRRYYFPVLEEKFNAHLRRRGMPAAADYLTATMQDARKAMEQLIDERIAAGEINDGGQARKSLAGNGFQALVFLALCAMQADGFIPSRVVFSLKPKNHSVINKFAVIKTGGEELKPDLDLMARAEESDHVDIYSLKTSLRERAGQTHRWKLLMDIATAPDAKSLRDKYGLVFAGGKKFRMNLITTNFYDEITAPQQRGLLRFFDRAYLTKPGDFAAPVLNFPASPRI